MLTLAERITALMTYFSCDEKEIALRAGVKTPSVYDWRNGRTKNLLSEPACNLVEYYRLSLRWIATGAGEMFNNNALTQDELTVLEGYRAASEDFKQAMLAIAQNVLNATREKKKAG
jgi:transcriptional regulator with XRE-family HTH domain